ncbi:MAG: AraC family transcriptional regulator [Bacteroidaceae bacterium]|nr:AraC family transcriptional regulator [Bacteroidaceae bacterium]
MERNEFLHIRQANDYAFDVGAAVWHPMVSVIHFDELGEIRYSLNKLEVYAIFVQDNFPSGSTYGMGGYNTSKGSLTAASPGQIIGKADDGHREVYHGWALFFDPEFMRGTVFEKRLADYHFFSYNVNEALHATEDEKQLLWRLMEMIRTFISHREQTALTDSIVQDYIVLLCDYCKLFYQRQFQSETQQQSDLLTRFQHVLTDYYEQQLQLQYGLPSVKYCASELCLSPSYFGDVVRSITGNSPLQVIHRFLIDRAKSLLVGGSTVAEVAEALGFEYAQHFTRFFKKHTGMLPSKYVASLKHS